MAAINIDYSSLPFSDLEANDRHQHGASDCEMQQMPASRTTSHFSTLASLGEASDDQKDPLVKRTSFSWTKAAFQAPLRKSSIQQLVRSKKRLQGWRFGLAVSASTVTFVLLTNVLLVVVAVSVSKLENGIGSLYTGDCKRVSILNTALHVVINILSSVLLSASNYATQVLVSPTRSECDKAHTCRDWLDIGVSGLRNLTRISWQRRILWALLGISSIPIHLLFNSAVFKTLDANEYTYYVVSEDFLEGAPISSYDPAPELNSFAPELNGTRPWHNAELKAARERYDEKIALYEHLSPLECISRYGGTFVSGYSNLFLVTKSINADMNVFFDNHIDFLTYGDVLGPLNDDSNIWVCETLDPSEHEQPAYCDTAKLRDVASSNWTIKGQEIDHCRSERTEPHCKLEFSIHILVAVIACNLIKSAAMFWTLFRQRESTLVTFGDALASYLEQPDECTTNRCLTSKENIVHPPKKSTSPTWKADTPPPVPFSRDGHRWHSAISSTRWLISVASCITAIAATSALLHTALSKPNPILAPNPLTVQGFGSFSPATVLNVGVPRSGTTGLLLCVLLANLPQLIMSFLYLMYNGLYTSMHLAHEYGSYATKRKPLRVTTPKGSQRSTYWLQLPYAYGVPLIVTSAVLHWLISQSIFLARVSVWADGVQVEGSAGIFSAVGYSPAPILCAIILGVCMLLVFIGMGFRGLPGTIPIAGSCSVALAAAAHRPEGDVDAAVLPVKWGVVHQSENAEAVGHCCFTSEDVTEPQEGRLYAGDMRSTVNGLRWRAGISDNVEENVFT